MVFRACPVFHYPCSIKLYEMAQKTKLKDPAEIAKTRNIKLERCPTKLTIAKKIPKEELEDLISK